MMDDGDRLGYLVGLIGLMVLNVCNWTRTAYGARSAWVREKGGAPNPLAPVTPSEPLSHAGEHVPSQGTSA